MPGKVLSTKDTTVNRTGRNPVFVTSEWGIHGLKFYNNTASILEGHFEVV